MNLASEVREFDPARFQVRTASLYEFSTETLHKLTPFCVGALRSWAQQEGLPVRARHTHLDQLAAPGEAGLVISAPGSLSPKRWGQLGTALKHRFPGWRAALLCPGDAWKTLALKPKRTLRVKDGELEATIVVLELWAGRKDW